MEQKLIDVSRYQGLINWTSVRADGYEYAIIRTGYRGYQYGNIVNDPMATTNIVNARKVGIKVGLYFFSQAVNLDEARMEAKHCITYAKNYGCDLPIFIDYEWSGAYPTGRGDKITKDLRTDIILEFINEVEKAGFKAGVYSGAEYFKNQLVDDKLQGIIHWVADYDGDNNYKGKTHIRQYSSQGRVKGIIGDVDLNVVYDMNALVSNPLQTFTYKANNKTNAKAFAVKAFELELPLTVKVSSGDYDTLEELVAGFSEK